MKCKNCGAENIITAKHCNSCGNAISSTIDDLAKASTNEMKQQRLEKQATKIFAILIFLVVVMIPVMFFYMFLPEPAAEEAHVTVPFSSIDIVETDTVKTGSETIQFISADTNPLKTNNFIAFRSNPATRNRLMEFYLPDSKTQFQEKIPSLGWLMQKQAGNGGWGSRTNSTQNTSHCLLALLSMGVDPGRKKNFQSIITGMEHMYDKKTLRIRSNSTLKYSLILLTLTELTLIYPEYETLGNLKGHYKHLLTFHGASSGGFPDRLSSTGHLDEPSSLFALRTIGEGYNAGIINIPQAKIDLSLAFLASRIREHRKFNKTMKREDFRNRALATYAFVLLSKGNLNDLFKDEINILINDCFVSLEGGREFPKSVLGAHYLLVTLFRTRHMHYASFKTRLLEAYDKIYDQADAHWQNNLRLNILGATDDEIVTAVLFRSFAHFQLYPVLGK